MHTRIVHFLSCNKMVVKALCLLLPAATAALSLSSPRRMLAGVTVGKYSLFAGGMDGKTDSDAVDIFCDGHLLRTDRLSEARGLLAATALGDELAFFAGGQNHAGNKSAAVDIFNASDGSWSVAALSTPRSMLAASSAAGRFALFAGGELAEHEGNTSRADVTDRVDVYDRWSGAWSTAALVVPRKKLAATSMGDLAIFGGGYLSGGGGSRAEWDMFDGATRAWSAGNLSASRMRLQAATAGGKVLFLGGMGDACGADCTAVDVFDGASRTWSTPLAGGLTRGRYEFAAVGVGDAVVVAGGKQNASAGADTGGAWDLVEVFHTATGAWTFRIAPAEARSYVAAAAHTLASGEQVALVAGGDCQNGTTTALVDVLRA